MTSRASVQVENFAERLDQLPFEFQDEFGNQQNAEAYALARHGAAIWLLDEFKTLSANVALQLEGEQSSDGQSTLSKTWRGRIQSVKERSLRSSHRFDSSLLAGSQSDEASLQEVKRAQAEVNTWELLSSVLAIRKPAPTGVDLDNSIQVYFDIRGSPHQFTPNAELWERFLLGDQSARERQAVLKWLEACARKSDADLDTIVDQLEESAGTGKGTWSHGFLHTRERIKAEKRRKGIDTFLESATLRTSENTEPLVSQLDPDASTRQGRNLEKPDDYYDRSLWLACFAMLRRGMSWNQVREWCEERREGWRAASFGMATTRQESKTGLGGPQAGLLWRQMCLASARQKSFDTYQRAVYGLLAGDIQSVDPACRSFDDLLYARYNALLIRSFEDYLRKSFPNRFSAILNQKFPALNSTLSEEELEMEPDDYVYKVSNHPACADEASEPIKILQASIIGDDFERLVTHLGIVIAYKANKDRPSKLIPPLTDYTFQERYACLAEDFDAIRMAVHILAIYEYVGYDFPEPYRYDAIENVIVAYIDYLRIQGKIEAIPTYAGLLSAERRHRTLGVVLVDITERVEQEALVKLMGHQDVNVARVVIEQYMYAADLMGLLTEDWSPIARFDLLEATDDSRWPGYRIKRDFKARPLSMEEDRLVRSVEWFLHVPSLWRETFYGMSYAMRAFLLSGLFNAALEVTKRIPYVAVSQKKSSQYLNRSVDVFEDQEDAGEEVAHDLRRSTRASSRRPFEPKEPLSEEDQFTLDMLKAQSRQYREMQQLCLALEHLSIWMELETMIPANKELVTIEMKKDMREVQDDLAQSMKPLLHGFMTVIDDEQEVPYYTLLRRLYLPPTILAYNSACTFAANYLGPETLLPALELATLLASDVNAELAEDFVQAGLMEHFMKAMAGTSRVLIRLNQEVEIEEERMKQEGKKTRRKRGVQKGRFWIGESLDIWDPTRIN